ncbi:GntR family transcriptional regulator [Streptomyces sp. NPDC056352]|uniref:GntR family transcriptional regulator n=1 Tax=Streptomyces sp. NPDC056352 TaxID=3345791 RepID=UPI0035D58E78
MPSRRHTIAADLRTQISTGNLKAGERLPSETQLAAQWVQTCRRELLDRTLIWNRRHLRHALREFERFYNCHRPHQGIANARPLQPLPAVIADPGRIADLGIRRRERLGGIVHEYQHVA